MTYVVAGTSGHTGRVVAETLLESGTKVRVVVRDAAKGEAWKARGAEVAVASLDDAEAIAKALEGAKGAYLLVPPPMGVPDTLAAQARVVDAIARALERTPVPHVVFLSSVGAHLPDRTGPILGLARAEKRLRAVPGVAFTFLRAPYFMENLGASLGGLEHGVFATFLDGSRAVPMAATVDIGRVAAKSLLGGASTTEVLELHGLPVTPAEAAKTFGSLVGKELALEVGPTSVMASVLQGYGFTADLAGLYAEMTAGINEGRIFHEGGHPVAQATTPLASVAATLLGKS